MNTTQPATHEDAVDHRGLQVLDFDDCLERTRSMPMGRVAFHDRGDFAVLPVTHVVDNLTIAFRARWDSRLAETVREGAVAFEVDDFDPISRTGWSVLFRGVATTVDDDAECRRLEELLDSPWEGAPEENFWIRIRPEEVTGRELATNRNSAGCC